MFISHRPQLSPFHPQRYQRTVQDVASRANLASVTMTWAGDKKQVFRCCIVCHKDRPLDEFSTRTCKQRRRGPLVCESCALSNAVTLQQQTAANQTGQNGGPVSSRTRSKTAAANPTNGAPPPVVAHQGQQHTQQGQHQQQSQQQQQPTPQSTPISQGSEGGLIRAAIRWLVVLASKKIVKEFGIDLDETSIDLAKVVG